MKYLQVISLNNLKLKYDSVTAPNQCDFSIRIAIKWTGFNKSYFLLGPIVRKYKRYVDDPILPVPNRTLHYWKKTANCTDSSSAEMLESVTGIRSHDQTHLNQGNAPPSMGTDTTECICDLDKEDSINDFGLPVQDQPFLQDDDTCNDASSNHPG